MIRKAFLVLLACAAALWAAGYAVEWRGPFVDALVSRALSGRTGLSVTVRHAALARWSRVRFSELSAALDGRELFSSSGGELALRNAGPLGGGGSVSGRLSTVRPAAQWGENSALSSLGVPSAGRIDECLFSVRQLGPDRWLVRITRMDFAPYSVLGGLVWQSGRAVKGNGLLLADKGRSEGWPDPVRRRLLSVNGKDGVRVTYANGMLRAAGARGPFFEMRWGS